MPKQFITAFIAVILLYGGYVGANFAIIFMAGETQSYADIVSIQQKNPNILYGPLFNNDHASYKYALYSQRKGDVVMVGSSRTLQFRQVFFNKQMVNCGRVVGSVRNALEFFHVLASDHSPQTVIVIMDFWWFRKPLRKITGGHKFTQSTGTERSLDMFFLPSKYILEGKIDIVKLIRRSVWFNQNALCNIGIRGIENNAGFAADGSFHNSNLVGPTQEEMVADIKARNGSQGFSYHNQLEKESVDAFFQGITELKQAGKKVIVIFSPLSPALYEEISINPGYKYIEKTVNYSKSLGALDYLNPAQLRLKYNDFIDALHTSSRADAIMLLAIAQNDPELRNILNIKFLNTFIASGKLTP